MNPYFIGVDVGTGSVRAGLFSEVGELCKVATRDILVDNPEPGFYQQSSEDIWRAVCDSVKEIVAEKPLENIRAISFCGTCSLVAIGVNDDPISICKSKNPKWNVIMWMDHRAEAEAAQINSTNHSVLANVGGRISLEMQTPKILWLKTNLPESYQQTKNYFDLSDYLRWKGTGSEKRSICTLVCKWTFVNKLDGDCRWDHSYFEQIGLGKDDCLSKFGDRVSLPGDSDMISDEAATNLGMTTKTKVGFSMIDAHSGVLGLIGCGTVPEKGKEGSESCSGIYPALSETFLTSRLALICGTSNCVMALSKKPISVHGAWGPYCGVILNQYYLAEGGQSVSGKLVDHIVSSHKAYNSLLGEHGSHAGVLSHLEDILVELGANRDMCSLTRDLHIWPDFHGNRSPIADPTLKGMVTGFTLSESKEDLAVLYLATLQAIAYGIRHIKETLEQCGYEFNEIVVCGGLTKSKLFNGLLADSMGTQVVQPSCKEPVLLGSAISAAAAHNRKISGSDSSDSVLQQMLSKMSGNCTRIQPNLNNKRYHDKKYQVFLRILNDQLEYRKIMAD